MQRKGVISVLVIMTIMFATKANCTEIKLDNIITRKNLLANLYKNQFDTNISIILSNTNNTTNNTTNCDKSQLVALLLSIFVGQLGVDRFYLGYTDLGIGKVMLSAGTSVVLLVSLLLLALFVGCSSLCSGLCGLSDNCGSFGMFCGIANMGIGVVLIVCIIIICAAAYLAISIWWLVDLILIATSQLGPLAPLCYSSKL